MSASSIANERYVLFTTFKRDGSAVGTAVWIAPLENGRACFTTGGGSAKVKRLRNDARVTLQRCDYRGRITPGSPVVEATARVVVGADCEPVNIAMRKKYAIQFRILEWTTAITSRVRRQSVADAGVVVDFS
ncbi:MAG: PPOX class F420-dependent oxidoreductase [Actinobacteria bacterium]|nr:PPOX class F420-dependent oxidoreductase [Actinomycetota bacterium]